MGKETSTSTSLNKQKNVIKNVFWLLKNVTKHSF